MKKKAKCAMCEEMRILNKEDLCKSCEKDSKLMDAHGAEILKVYGKARAKKANIGWGQSEGSIASKVYGNPTMVVTSSLRRNKVIHEHTNY